MSTSNRKPLFKWAAWFYAGNVLLFWLIGFQYIIAITPLAFPVNTFLIKFLCWSFLLLAYIGQLALLALIPAILFVIPLMVFCFRKQNFIFIISILLSAAATTLLVIDASVFQQFHFHLNGIVFEFITSKAAEQIFDFSWLEYLQLGLMFGGFLLLESCYAILIWKKIINYSLAGIIRLATASIICLLLSYYMFILGAIHPMQSVNKQAIALPLYENFLSDILPAKYNLPYLSTLGNQNFAQLNQPSKKLNYPLHPLACNTNTKPYNLVIIVIDTWRHDLANAVNTPHIAQFAQNNWTFTQHHSGGNGTQPGIFSLFYGLPASYWTATIEQKRSPILIDELLRRHYQMGIFASADLSMPAFNKNIFSGIKNLQIKTPGKTVYDRDRIITDQFREFITNAKKTNQPFFSFIFYDSAHSFCTPENPPGPFQPAIKTCGRLLNHSLTNSQAYANRYKNNLYFLDDLVEEDLAELDEQNLLNNTVVLITADHGNEFNDNHLGYWGHASNFTHYQTQVPLLIHWPKKSAATFKHATNHYDIAPTLLTDLLGCKNPASDYSTGHSLLTEQNQAYLLVHSYTNFGIIESNRITTILPTGDYQIEDLNGHPIPNAKLHLDVLKQAFDDMNRFTQK